MTWQGRLISLFPLLHLSLIIGSILAFIFEPSACRGFGIVFALYIFAPLLFRIHHLIWPLVDGETDIAERVYNPWWTSHQLQMIYITWPFIENALHTVPGLFSVWLRCWGSRIGRGVYWSPRVELVDRGLVDIGDHVVIGHLTTFCSHAVTPKGGRLRLLIKRVHIERGAFIGAEVRLGPGSFVAAGQLVRSQTTLYWKGELK